jgi:hypothetical protein
MASFMEAMKAAREGKRVRAPHGEWMKAASRHMVWADPRERDNYVLLTLDMVNLDWEIEQPPPKRYTFLEAVAMMEQGKTMLSPNGMRTKLRSTLLANENNGPKMLLLEEINGMWTEETQS